MGVYIKHLPFTVTQEHLHEKCAELQLAEPTRILIIRSGSVQYRRYCSAFFWMESEADAVACAAAFNGLDQLGGLWLEKPLHAETTEERGEGDVLGKQRPKLLLLLSHYYYYYHSYITIINCTSIAILKQTHCKTLLSMTSTLLVLV